MEDLPDLVKESSISFGDFIHDNYYAVSGGWWQFFPPKFGNPFSTSELFEIYLGYCKNLNNEPTT